MQQDQDLPDGFSEYILKYPVKIKKLDNESALKEIKVNF